MVKRVIIADDTAPYRKMLVESLRDMAPDAEVEDVPSGEDLVERVRRGGYSLVLTDYDMGPGMDGIDAIIAIRKLDLEVPIYMISGSQKREEALKNRATGYIDKDYKTLVTELEQVVSRHLK